MSGFFKASIISEHFTNAVVNTLWYRSDDWNPLGDNPYADTTALLAALWTHIGTMYTAICTPNQTILRVEGVAYTDDFQVATSSPVIQTINASGTRSYSETSGSFISATLGFTLGVQHQINLIGTSKRNNGYLALPPVSENDVDSYGHLSSTYVAAVNNVAQLVDDSFVALTALSNFIPVRIHEKYMLVPKPLPNILLWRTYSDILGYRLPRRATTRRSRMGEA